MLSFKYMDNQFIFIMYEIKSNKTFGFLLLVCFIVGMAFIAPVSALTHITDATGLQNMNLNLAEDYVLDNDIDLSGVTWTPVGTDTDRFRGSLNGNNYSISNLYITDGSVRGLFSYVDTAEIRNVILSNVTVGSSTTSLYSGILIGLSGYSIVENCKIYNSSISGNVDIGGVIGYSVDSTINMCYVNATVSSVNYCGGFVGGAYALTDNIISNCVFNGNINGSSAGSGGFIGRLLSGTGDTTISNSYDLGSIIGNNGVGGFVGIVYSSSLIIQNSVCLIEEIDATTNCNRLVGDLIGGSIQIINSYAWKDMQAPSTGWSSSTFTTTSYNGANITSIDILGNKPFFETMLSWDIGDIGDSTSIWTINDLSHNTFPLPSSYYLPLLAGMSPAIPSYLVYTPNFTCSDDVTPCNVVAYNTNGYSVTWQKSSWNPSSPTTYVWTDAGYTGSSATIDINSGIYAIRMKLTNSQTGVVSYSPHIKPIYGSSLPTLLTTEELSLNTYLTQTYNPVQQYALSASVLDMKYVSGTDGYLISGTTPYRIDSRTSNVVPLSDYVGNTAMLCSIGDNGIAIYDSDGVLSYYSYATQSRQIIAVVDNVRNVTLGKASVPDAIVIVYTTDINTCYYRLDTGITYTSNSIFDGIVGSSSAKTFLSWNNANPSNITITYLVYTTLFENSTNQLNLTAGTTIQSIQSIDATNNFIIRTTDKIFVVEAIGSVFTVISESASDVPAFSEVRADKQLEYMGLNDSSVYFVDNNGNVSTYYTGIARFNTLGIASETGIWCAVGGNDMRLSILGKSSPTTWNLTDQLSFTNIIDKVVLSTGGYYIAVVSDGSLYLLSQATPYTTDTVLTTKYYLQVYLMDGGQYLGNTRFTVGIGETAPTTYTTDSSGSYVVEVVPSRTYTIAFYDGSKSITYTANNFALQYLILSKPSGAPFAPGLTSDVSLDYRLVHMSYFDSDGRNNLVNFTIWNATTILQTYSSVTNDVSYIYDATESDDSYLAVILHVSNPDSGYTYDKSYTVWLKKYADPTNQTGLILPGAKKPLIPAPFWSDVGLPVKLDGELIQLIICGILMVIAGLFGAQHSAKGALLVAGIAVIFTVLGLLVIDPIWVAMMVVIGILTLFSYARDYD